MENDLLADTISKYRDDADLQNLIDWIQAEWASINPPDPPCSSVEG